MNLFVNSKKVTVLPSKPLQASFEKQQNVSLWNFLPLLLIVARNHSSVCENLDRSHAEDMPPAKTWVWLSRFVLGFYHAKSKPFIREQPSLCVYVYPTLLLGSALQPFLCHDPSKLWNWEPTTDPTTFLGPEIPRALFEVTQIKETFPLGFMDFSPRGWLLIKETVHWVGQILFHGFSCQRKFHLVRRSLFQLSDPSLKHRASVQSACYFPQVCYHLQNSSLEPNAVASLEFASASVGSQHVTSIMDHVLCSGQGNNPGGRHGDVPASCSCYFFYHTFW